MLKLKKTVAASFNYIFHKSKFLNSSKLTNSQISAVKVNKKQFAGPFMTADAASTTYHYLTSA